MNNVFDGIPTHLTDELICVLAENESVRIERIVSAGHTSPEGFWYDQDENEWVIVLSGAARLRLEGDNDVIELSAGNHINIPAHRKHRVEWTTPDEPTVWLAVFYKSTS